MMSPFSKLIRDFIESDISKSYIGYVEEPMTVFTAIFGLNDFMKAHFTDVNTAYTNREAVEKFFLQFLPGEYVAFPEEAIVIHELILDLYQFLYKQSYINKKEYHRILRILQSDKPDFLKRMVDEKYWSKEKRRILSEVEQYRNEDFFSEGRLLKDVNFRQLDSNIDKLNRRVEAAALQKVVPFPGTGVAVQTPWIFQLRVDLLGFKPPVWRRILIMEDTTFSDLHHILQKVFEWDDAHVYVFQTADFAIQPAFGICDRHRIHASVKDSEATLVRDVLPHNKTVNYVYDLQNNWRHKIKVEDTFSEEDFEEKFPQLSLTDLPVCVKGKGSGPIENPDDGSRAAFDMKLINQRLERNKKR